MAQRRMFSLQIIDTDDFLDMPASTQNLYFHLGMRADDDGLLGNAKTIKRIVGASDDDLKILVAKGYLIVLTDSVLAIRDWHIHNYVQKDRYHETVYKKQKKMLELNSNKQYVIRDIAGTNSMDTKCIHNVSKMDTQVRLGKDRLELGKDSTYAYGKETSDKKKILSTSLKSNLINQFIVNHQIRLTNTQKAKINEYVVRFGNDKIILNALKKAVNNNNEPNLRLPFNYFEKIVQNLSFEDRQNEKIANRSRREVQEQLPK